jgi:tetratricopeptide (TPR) repeat protein
MQLFGERMRAARLALLSLAFALQFSCDPLFGQTPKVGVKEALHLRKITEYWKEGHFEDAKQQLESYLAAYSESPYLNEVFAMLGDLYLQEGKLEEALDCYKKIESNECQSLTALHRAEVLYQLGRYEELIAWGEEKSDVLSMHERIHLLLGDCHYRAVLKDPSSAEAQNAAKAALSEFAKLKNLDKEWQLVVAYLNALSGRKLKAADLYLSLANEFPNRRDELHLQAAFLLEKEDPSKAISLLHEIALHPGALQKNAAFNELVLLFREKQYAEFLKVKEGASLLLDQDLSALIYYTGIAHFELGNYEAAAEFLEKFADATPNSKEEFKTTLRSLFYCGHKTQNTDLIKKALAIWRKELDLDEEYLNGLRISATSLLQAQDYASAKSALQEILDRFPSHAATQNALWDYSQALLCLNELYAAKKNLELFTQNFPQSPHIAGAWQNLIYLTTELLKSAASLETAALQGDLAAYLKEALKHSSLFDAETTRAYRLHLTHLLFDASEFKQASEMAANYINSYSAHPSCREVRFIQINSNLNLGLPLSSLIEPMQKALTDESDPDLAIKLHMQLFNAYVSQNDFVLAIEHLIAVYKDGSLPIKSENLLWLADAMLEDKDFALAKEIYAKALAKNTTLDPLVYEEATLKLKKLYLDDGDSHSALAVLTELNGWQQREPSLQWRHPKKVLFEIAELQESMGKREEAILSYDAVIGDDAFANSSYYQSASMLNKARLQLELLAATERREGSPQLICILGMLKDLSIARNVESEPIHLEAALEYATIRSSLLPQAEQTKRMIFYLDRIEEDFLNETSDIGAAYQSMRQQMPEQNQLIEGYLQYIAAERKRLKAQEALKVGDAERHEALKAASKRELQTMSAGLTETSAQLKTRVAQSLCAMD